uniref:Uncharacterized protein n=1 Tax=Acrobeloides nanus TaxID=290746 RepID=A0A914CEC5_9BILA
MVIGSQWPWVEVICLVNGAKKVITVDFYNNAIIDHGDITYKNAIELVKESKNIEHSGLRRYGDPIDPIGDIREASLLVKMKLYLIFTGYMDNLGCL